MPLVYQQNINANSRIGVWHITEQEVFFQQKVVMHNGIGHPHKKLQHLAGRYLLKHLYEEFPLDQIRIAESRRPFLEDKAFHFSIAHCADYAAVIVSDLYRVGIDVEMVSPKASRVKHKFLSGDEQATLEGMNEGQNTKLSPDKLATLGWSIKEALFKWNASPKVDFIKHLKIHHIDFQAERGIAHCELHYKEPILLQVIFIFFEEYCLSWVIGNE